VRALGLCLALGVVVGACSGAAATPSPTHAPTLTLAPPTGHARFTEFLQRQAAFGDTFVKIADAFSSLAATGGAGDSVAALNAVNREVAWLQLNPPHPCYFDAWSRAKSALDSLTQGVVEFVSGDRTGAASSLRLARGQFTALSNDASVANIVCASS
jgi:hypothetical protein